MPFPRFRIRTLMIAVAVMGLTLGGVIEAARLWNLRRLYRGLAQNFSYWEVRYNGLLKFRQDLSYYSAAQPLGPEPSPTRRARMQALARYYGEMRRKYERAADRPWEYVAPDPTPP